MKNLTFLLTLLITSILQAQSVDLSSFKGMKTRNIGPAGMSGRVTSIDVDLSRPERIFVGTASGGVWKSESGGIRWEPIFDKQPIQSIGAVCINQQNPSEIWVGTGEGNPRNSHNSGEGLYKSIDGGKTWTLMGLENSRLIHRIIIHPQNPDVVFVGALGSAWGPGGERGVFKTIDGGKTWKNVLFVNDSTGIADMVIDPHNPNKIIAAMWEFGRKPWVFKSGGKGSGLYMTYDAGENWKEITDKEGLPKGDLGRIGLSFAPSKPNLIYALVEAKKNALYKSLDGGHKWLKVSDKNIGNRPFYYADIFVDPQNENRIWNLWSYVSKSEDGGKTFKTILDYGKGVHPDHHAFWMHPTDPSYIIEGNDGGLNISRDGGQNWAFIANLPLAQFYHINYDMDFPYHVMGGMQDNGTWVGPSMVLKRGGIRNNDWQEVMFGDGFDAMLHQNDNRFGWGMSQGGNIGYFDRQTGRVRYVKPLHPDGIGLRFNWNAALAQDPFDANSLYFGSQFVHHSSDKGQNWTILSPDLTMNDSAKIIASSKTGGLTPDVTQAENFNSILCIAPSPVNKEVIWVGTDDGNLQLTRDGGKSWTNLADQLPGCPSGSWIPQIEVSLKNAGEAFVVVNNYRRNDWTPYLYHTSDFGVSWKRLIDDKKVKGHALSVVQDPVVPSLLFLGTDYGLYISIDMGENWSRWKHDFPAVSVRDLKIHPRENDLIIGTFGRAAWILDDIQPLRDLAESKGKMVQDTFKICKPRTAYFLSYRSADGMRFTADGEYIGENTSYSPQMYIWSKPLTKAKGDKSVSKNKDAKNQEDKKGGKKSNKKSNKKTTKKTTDPTDTKSDKTTDKKDPPKSKKGDDKKLYITILNMNGDTIRSYHQKSDTALYKIYLQMSEVGVRFPSYKDPKPDANPPRGLPVLPGQYRLYVKHRGTVDSTVIEIKNDPRESVNMSDLLQVRETMKGHYKYVDMARNAFDQLKKAKATTELVDKMFVNLPDSTKKEMSAASKEVRDSINKLMLIFLPSQKPSKGINRTDETLQTHLYRANSYLMSSDGKPSQMALIALKKAKSETEDAVSKVDQFIQNQWMNYQKKVESIEFSPFTELKLMNK